MSQMDCFAPVIQVNDDFSELREWLSNLDFSSLFILVDENTHELCLPLLLNKVDLLQRIEIVELPSGEENKSLEILAQIWSTLTEYKADRKTLVLNLGGGVICDLGGFAAGCYKRGVAYVNLPTTLLAQADAAHGGKTGIDMDGFKNQIGLFNPPLATFIYSDFCNTLPERQFLSGFAECLKHSLIADADLWRSFLLTGKPDPSITHEFISRVIEIKEKIVREDPRETGLRKVLNFGHTVGHALESLALLRGEDLLHGEAVAMGMIAEMYISTHACNFSQADLQIAAKFISSIYSFKKVEPTDFNTILDLMQQDKKNQYGEMLLSLLEIPGKAVFDQPVESFWVFEALEYLNQHARG